MANQQGRQLIGGFSNLTAGDIASYIGKTLTANEENIVRMLISASELYFAKATNQNFKQDTIYTETFNAGLGTYSPSNFPIKEIETIELDGVAVYTKGVTGLFKLGTDFFVYDDWVQFKTYQQSITDNINALVITYTIKPTFQADAKFALLLWVANFFLNREFGGKDASDIAMGDLQQTFTANVPDYIKQVILSYKKYNV